MLVMKKYYKILFLRNLMLSREYQKITKLKKHKCHKKHVLNTKFFLNEKTMKEKVALC
jgi:hypothetical protein